MEKNWLKVPEDPVSELLFLKENRIEGRGKDNKCHGLIFSGRGDGV